MDSERYLVIDLDRCWGCGACQVACKQEHDLRPGWSPVKIVKVGPERTPKGLSAAFIPVMCQHCDEPRCLEVCPAGAVAKTDDGWVLVDPETCLGCGACVEDCPYGALKIDEGASQPVPVKCDACIGRQHLDLPPSCVQHCVGRAIGFLSKTVLKDLVADRKYWSAGKVVYLASDWCALGEGLGLPSQSTVANYLSERRNSR